MDTQVTFSSLGYNYTITRHPFGSNIDLNSTKPTIWMRSVYRHQRKNLIDKTTRQTEFTNTFGHSASTLKIFNKRFKSEASIDSSQRISYEVQEMDTTKHLISTKEADQRARKRIRRAVQATKTAYTSLNNNVAAATRFGIMQSGGKYDTFRRVYKSFSDSSKLPYGARPAQFPSVKKTNDIADSIYNNPELYSSAPDWTVRYRKGKSKLINDKLLVPSQQISLTQMEKNDRDYQNEDEIIQHIRDTLHEDGINPLAIKVRKRDGSLSKYPIRIAAHVFFESAYHTRSAIQTLKPLGRVSMGQVIVTARVVASKVIDVINMLLTEAHGELATEELSANKLSALSQVKLPTILVQEWIDKDGRVSFIKLKLVDPSHLYFKHGESRVANLLEFVGDENECRRFYPHLVDQFHQCNNTRFQLPNDVNVRVQVCLCSGDHKAAWAKTGRSGGHETRDLFSDKSLASMYHRIAYQDTPQFGYKRYMTAWKSIQANMLSWKQNNIEAKRIVTQTQTREHLMKLYRIHGRVERVPALGYGVITERPDVYNNILITPLVLHNQSYCNLITLELGLNHLVKRDSIKLKGLQGRLRGLLDGFGTTKCSTSGTGIRNLINDCLILAQDTKTEYLKYAPIWYLQDTICHHLHLKGMTNNRIHVALLDHERLCFASCTLLWWALIGDLSTTTGGRKLKNTSKNHLENKIYGYEMVNVCPEWEEHQRIPLSLIDEANFEATFAFRDEVINNLRSKVNIEQERKVQWFHRICKQIAPTKRYASILAGLPRHIRHNIVILSCWRDQTKWSFAIRTGFLPRIAKYSYHNRVTLSTTHDIYLNITGERDTFYTDTDETTRPTLVYIDPCGQCHGTPKPIHFPITLQKWYLRQRIKLACVRTILWLQRKKQIKSHHVIRANRYREKLKDELKKNEDDRDDNLVHTLYQAYMVYNTKYPNEITSFRRSRTLKNIIKKHEQRNREQEIWNGDVKELPSNLDQLDNDRGWTVRRLKSVIRFFQLHEGNNKRTTALSGRRGQLLDRVKTLLRQYLTVHQLPDVL
jgi:hypothetical protein